MKKDKKETIVGVGNEKFRPTSGRYKWDDNPDGKTPFVYAVVRQYTVMDAFKGEHITDGPILFVTTDLEMAIEYVRNLSKKGAVSDRELNDPYFSRMAYVFEGFIVRCVPIFYNKKELLGITPRKIDEYWEYTTKYQPNEEV